MVSNWLTAILIKHLEYELTKQKLWNAFLIWYDWLLNSIPYQCVCEAFFNVTHAFWCKKGVFITLRHNEDITTELHNEACVNVRKEPILLELNTEDLPRQVNNIKEAWLDISEINFWKTGQRTFFDIRVFNLSLREKCLSKNTEFGHFSHSVFA